MRIEYDIMQNNCPHFEIFAQIHSESQRIIFTGGYFPPPHRVVILWVLSPSSSKANKSAEEAKKETSIQLQQQQNEHYEDTKQHQIEKAEQAARIE